MAKTTTISARIDADIKKRAEQIFRELGEIHRYENSSKALLEAVLVFIKGDKTAPADGLCRSALSGTGFAQDKGGEIFHPVPQVAVV